MGNALSSNSYAREKPDFMKMGTDKKDSKHFDFNFTIRRKFFILNLKEYDASDSNGYYPFVRSIYIGVTGVASMILPYMPKDSPSRLKVENELELIEYDIERIDTLSRSDCNQLLIKLTRVASICELFFENMNKGMEITRISEGKFPKNPQDNVNDDYK